MKRKNVLHERSHQCPSFSIHLYFKVAITSINFGLHQPGQSAVHGQPNKQTHISKHRSLSAVHFASAAQVGIPDTPTIKRRTESDEEARRFGRDGDTSGDEVIDGGPLETVDERLPPTTALLRQKHGGSSVVE